METVTRSARIRSWLATAFTSPKVPTTGTLSSLSLLIYDLSDHCKEEARVIRPVTVHKAEDAYFKVGFSRHLPKLRAGLTLSV